MSNFCTHDGGFTDDQEPSHIGPDGKCMDCGEQVVFKVTELSLVSTKDMLTEIEKRFDCMIFCGTVNRTAENNELEWLMRGGTPAALGLARFAEKKAWQIYMDDETAVDNLIEPDHQ